MRNTTLFIIICSVITILFLSSVSSVSAIPNPSAGYCQGLGYKAEDRKSPQGDYSVCIFPDGSECSQWAYYCKCTGDKSSCGQTSTNCNFSCKNNKNTIYPILGFGAAGLLVLISVIYFFLNKRKRI